MFDWDKLKPLIYDLYVIQNKTLEEVRETLRVEYGITAKSVLPFVTRLFPCPLMNDSRPRTYYNHLAKWRMNKRGSQDSFDSGYHSLKDDEVRVSAGRDPIASQLSLSPPTQPAAKDSLTVMTDRFPSPPSAPLPGRRRKNLKPMSTRSSPIYFDSHSHQLSPGPPRDNPLHTQPLQHQQHKFRSGGPSPQLSFGSSAPNLDGTGPHAQFNGPRRVGGSRASASNFCLAGQPACMTPNILFCSSCGATLPLISSVVGKSSPQLSWGAHNDAVTGFMYTNDEQQGAMPGFAERQSHPISSQQTSQILLPPGLASHRVPWPKGSSSQLYGSMQTSPYYNIG